MANPIAGGVTRTLRVVGGGSAGRHFDVLPGTWTIGREADCDFVIDDPGVSRRHAHVTNSDGTLWLEDAGSRNGTWVDRERVTGRRRLGTGQTVRVGGALIRLDDGQEGNADGATPRPRRRVSLVRVAVVGALANLVLLAAGVLIQVLTDWTGIGTWLAAPLVGMVASLVEVGKEALTRPPSAPSDATTAPLPTGRPADGRGPPARARATGPSRRRAPVGAGIVVAVLVIGGGGVALAYGVGTLSAFITGNQSGTERLLDPVEVEAEGLTVSVESVEQTRDFTRVTLSVRSQLSNTITLPLYGNATLRDPQGNTLEADPFRSSWSDTIAPGQTSRGTVVFPGHLPSTETTATLSFATVFKQGFDGPDSIVVEGLSLSVIE